MTRYYLLCTQCGKRTEISEREAQAYGAMRSITGGEAACIDCGGAVKGEIEEKKESVSDGKE